MKTHTYLCNCGRTHELKCAYEKEVKYRFNPIESEELPVKPQKPIDKEQFIELAHKVKEIFQEEEAREKGVESEEKVKKIKELDSSTQFLYIPKEILAMKINELIEAYNTLIERMK